MAGRMMRFDGATDALYADDTTGRLLQSATWASASNSFAWGAVLSIDAPGGSTSIFLEVGASGVSFEVLVISGAIWVYRYRSDGNFRSYKTGFSAVPARQPVVVAINYDATTDTMAISIGGTAQTVTAGDSAAAAARVGGSSFKLGGITALGGVTKMAGWIRDLVMVRGNLAALDFTSFAADPYGTVTAGTVTPVRVVLGYVSATDAGSTLALKADLSTTITPTVTGTAIVFTGVQYAIAHSCQYRPTLGTTGSPSVTAWADQIGLAGSMADAGSTKAQLLTSPSTHLAMTGFSDLGTGTSAGVGINTRAFTAAGVFGLTFRKSGRPGVAYTAFAIFGYGASGTASVALCYGLIGELIICTLDSTGAVLEAKTPLDANGRKLILPSTRCRVGVSLGSLAIGAYVGTQFGTATVFTAAVSSASQVAAGGLIPAMQKTVIDHYGFDVLNKGSTQAELLAFMAYADYLGVGLDPQAARAQVVFIGTSEVTGHNGSGYTAPTHNNRSWAKLIEPDLPGVVMYNISYPGDTLADMTTGYATEAGSADILNAAGKGKSQRFLVEMDATNDITTTAVVATLYATSKALGQTIRGDYSRLIKVGEAPRSDAPDHNTTARQDRLLAFNALHTPDIGTVWSSFIDIEAGALFHVAAGYANLAAIQVITQGGGYGSDQVHFSSGAPGSTTTGHPVVAAAISLLLRAASSGGGSGRPGPRNRSDRRAMVIAA